MTKDLFSVTPDNVSSLVDHFVASPTPYHAVQQAAELLSAAGFVEIDRGDRLPSSVGGYFLAVGGTLFAWIQPESWDGFVVVGAHTDSPNLRVRKNPKIESAGIGQIGMEVYGGVLLNSWLDRDLGLAGRVQILSDDGTIEERLVMDNRPLLRIPQLAIHLDRNIRKDGLKLDPQRHVIPMWTTSPDEGSSIKDYIAELASCKQKQILSWDLMAFDTQRPTLAGRDNELFVSARIDNLYSSFAGLYAMCALGPAPTFDSDDVRMPVLALFDHEEVGSTSATGADGSLLIATLERIATASGQDREAFLTGMAKSFVLSTDGAHATHPNYPSKHDSAHPIRLNGGVVIKRNANQRYATDALGEAAVVKVCRQADIPHQFYIHRNDIPCGSTIGPVTAAKLGATTVDVGAPQLAMHSIRETAGIEDFEHLCRLIGSTWKIQP